MKFKIFTDGSSRGNPGPGGWGAIVSTADGVKDEFNMVDTNNVVITEIGGREDNTTNNRMELLAAVEALRHVSNITERGEVVHGEIFTDSAYLLNGATKWIFGWQKNNWQTTAKEDVLNRDIWEELADVMCGKKIIWHKLAGHSGIPANERCDRIATAYADNNIINLFHGSIKNYSVNLENVGSFGQEVSNKSTNKKKTKSTVSAYSYVSMVNGKVMTHSKWIECERRVKGVSGARFKKAISKENEEQIIIEFS